MDMTASTEQVPSVRGLQGCTQGVGSPLHSALQRLSADIEEAHERFSVLEDRLRFVCAPSGTQAAEDPCPEPSPHSGLVCTLNQHAELVEALISRAHKLLGALEV